MPSNEYETLSQRIFTRCLELGMSQRDIARVIEKSTATVSQLICGRRAQKRAYRIAVTRILRRLKEFETCVDCGYADGRALDYDHVRGDKYRDVSQLTGSNWNTILDEIAKCEVRCANCHRIITKERSDA